MGITRLLGRKGLFIKEIEDLIHKMCRLKNLSTRGPGRRDMPSHRFLSNFHGLWWSFAVAHNCYGKTKSHGKTNFTHGKTKLTQGKAKLSHGKTKLTHGKTKKTSWSAVGQRLSFASEMVRCVTVNKRNGDLCC